MPHTHHHRGAHPDDKQLFAPSAVKILQSACEEAAWLLDRGYPTNSVLDVVARRHQLRVRQRLALQRSMCSQCARQRRKSKEIFGDAVRGETIEIDGFNLIIGLEVALSGGLLLRGADGALRDLAGLRGTYHPVEETDMALTILGELFNELAIEQVRFYLDRPVSNSGQLRARILERACSWANAVQVELVANPDQSLTDRTCVVSSDSMVLDEARSWLNLRAHAVDSRIRSAWLVEMWPCETSPASV